MIDSATRKLAHGLTKSFRGAGYFAQVAHSTVVIMNGFVGLRAINSFIPFYIVFINR